MSPAGQKSRSSSFNSKPCLLHSMIVIWVRDIYTKKQHCQTISEREAARICRILRRLATSSSSARFIHRLNTSPHTISCFFINDVSKLRCPKIKVCLANYKFSGETSKPLLRTPTTMTPRCFFNFRSHVFHGKPYPRSEVNTGLAH